jgi:hypothetical protein
MPHKITGSVATMLEKFNAIEKHSKSAKSFFRLRRTTVRQQTAKIARRSPSHDDVGALGVDF